VVSKNLLLVFYNRRLRAWFRLTVSPNTLLFIIAAWFQ